MIIDALGRVVSLTGTPQRIVSLVPSLTEYLFAIGAGERIVGITDFCIEPAAQVAHIPTVGGPKNPNYAHIKILQPDLILAAKEENRKADVNTLADAGIPAYVIDICSVADMLDQLGTLATILECEQAATPILNDVRAVVAAAPGSQPEATHSDNRQRVLAFVWREPWMAVGDDTYAHDVLRLCGFTNAAASLPGRYPQATLEAYMQMHPHIIVLPNEPYPFTEADREAFAPFATVPAVQHQRIHIIDGKMLAWYGVRTAEALRFLTR